MTAKVLMVQGKFFDRSLDMLTDAVEGVLNMKLLEKNLWAG
jgi:hypothetical protein